MTAAFTPPDAAAVLKQATAFLRPRLDQSLPIKERLKTFWAGCVAARDLGPTDVIETEFLTLARETGIEDDLGRHADAGLRHVVRMALIGWNPLH